MINKKHIVIAAVLAMLSTGVDCANAESTNSLLQMDVKRSSVANTVDVTFYTTSGSSNSVVTRKSNNRYVVLLPNTDSTSSVTPGIGAVKDMISDVEVKHVNDGIGGYTKVTFSTTKPINIKTAVKKTSPLTQAQKDYKQIIAQNNTKPVQQAKPVATEKQAEKPATVATTTVKPAEKVASKSAAKSVQTQSTTKSQDTKNTTTTQKTAQKATSTTTQKTTPPVKVASAPKVTPIAAVKTKAAQQTQKPQQVKPVQEVKSQPKQVATPQPHVSQSADNYVPKMKFDENGRRILDLEPRISHEIVQEKPVKAPAMDPIFDLGENLEAQSVDADVQTNVPVAVEEPTNETSSTSHLFPMWILIAGGSVLALGVMYLVMDAMSHASKKDQTRLNSFFKMSSQNQAKRRRREYYDIVNDKELSWQEKYKRYVEKEEQRKPKKNPSDMSYVTDLSGLKQSIVMPKVEENKEEISKPTLKIPSELNLANSTKEKTHEQIVNEKLQAKISQLEHSLAQTPTVMEPEEISTKVRSEDSAIMKNVSDVKLKSFSKPMNLKETNRSTLAEDDKKLSRNNSYKEGRFVKLKNSPLSVNRRKSPNSNLEVSDLIGTGSKYLTNNGEMKMNKQNENYVLSSLDEYLSILDTEEKSSTATVSRSSVADSLSQMKSSNVAMSRSGVTNPIARGSNPMTRSEDKPMTYMNGLIVKSGYNIDSEKGFYLVNIDGVSALVGRIKDSIFVLKKFDHVVDTPLQVRPDDANVYIVKVGRYKCLVDVSKDKMGTLIEI